jgi:molecular chaperone GrpE
VKLVLAALQGVLAREGVEPLEPVGEPFDPNVHEALSTRAQDGAESGTVLEVVEKGYRTRDTVIRPARVVVSA